MISDRFDRAFARLLAAWTRHQDASRAVADVHELAAARIELEDARAEVAAARPPLPAPPVPRPTDEDEAAYWRRKAQTVAHSFGG